MSATIGPRFIGIGKETSYGQEATINKWFNVISESITSDQQYVDTETAAYRERMIRIPGPYKVAGDFDLYVTSEDAAFLYYGALGSITKTGTGPDYTYTIQPGTSIPTWSIEISPGIGTQSRKVIGAAISAVNLEAVAREAPTMTVSVIGKTEKLVTRTTPTFTTVRPFASFEGKMYVGGTEVATVEAIRINVENNIPDDVYALGDRFLQAIIPQSLSVSGDMDIRFVDWEWYKKFWGSDTATEPVTYPDTVSLKLEFTGAQIDTNKYHKLTIELPKCTLDTMDASFDRRERVVASVDFTALYDATISGAIKVTVVTTVANIP